jgi:predicted DNA-binding transcriptional regulator AlpA
MPFDPNALITFDQLMPIFGIAFDRSTVFRKRRAGTFPEPLMVSAQSIAWRRSDIEAWLAALPRASEAKPAPKPAPKKPHKKPRTVARGFKRQKASRRRQAAEATAARA